MILAVEVLYEINSDILRARFGGWVRASASKGVGTNERESRLLHHRFLMRKGEEKNHCDDQCLYCKLSKGIFHML